MHSTKHGRPFTSNDFVCYPIKIEVADVSRPPVTLSVVEPTSMVRILFVHVLRYVLFLVYFVVLYMFTCAYLAGFTISAMFIVIIVVPRQRLRDDNVYNTRRAVATGGDGNRSRRSRQGYQSGACLDGMGCGVQPPFRNIRV